MGESLDDLSTNTRRNKQRVKWRRVLFLPQGSITYPSSRYRLYQYLPLLKEHQIKYKILYPTRSSYFKRIIERVRLFYYLLWAEVVFIQKSFQSKKVMLIIRILGKKAVFDIDDAIWLINPSKKEEIPNFAEVQEMQEDQFKNNIKLFDKVIAGNDYLAEYIARYNHKVDVIPTVLRISNKTKKKRKRSKVTIGWVGASNNLYYLRRIKRVFTKIHEKYQGNVILKVVCDKPLELDSPVPVVNVKWKLDTENDEVSEFDIGIMPLIDDEWNCGKCAGKLLVYMALGIPAVASPVGINKDIVDNGNNGFLAGSEEEWFEHLCFLIESEQLRSIIGSAGQKTIARSLTPERFVMKLVEILLN